MKFNPVRIMTVVVAIFLMLTACGQGKKAVSQNPTAAKEGKTVTIVTSFYPMYIFTKNIAKDIPGVQVVNMTEPQTGCLHDYQLKPADMKVLEQAKILVSNGADMESFMDKVIQQLPNLKIVEASKGMELLKEEAHDQEDGHKEEGKEHDAEGAFNPHVWVSISGAIQEVKNIGEQLAVHDPANAVKYRSNTEEYVKRLEVQKGKMHSALKDIKTRDIVTFHEAFPYFAKEFNLNIVSVVEREPGSEPSAGELADLIKTVKDTKVKALFAEPQYSAKAAETIARETGAKVYILDPVATGPKDGDPEAYIKAMDKNLEVLLEALK
ncbi:MAG: zinc ABC transporter substrate-binding protein [Clostridia bacterium]|nr:zinc ABC transporter substrate-binding protein [Clostridia bacterium]